MVWTVLSSVDDPCAARVKLGCSDDLSGLAFVIDGAPEEHAPATDLHHYPRASGHQRRANRPDR